MISPSSSISANTLNLRKAASINDVFTDSLLALTLSEIIIKSNKISIISLAVWHVSLHASSLSSNASILKFSDKTPSLITRWAIVRRLFKSASQSSLLILPTDKIPAKSAKSNFSSKKSSEPSKTGIAILLKISLVPSFVKMLAIAWYSAQFLSFK